MSKINYAERIRREEQIKAHLEKGSSLSEIARDLGITSQSVHEFIKRRGWKTKEMERREGSSDDPTQQKKEARKEVRKGMPPSDIDRS